MPKNKFWSFKTKSTDTGELMLYGEISEYSWFGDEVTPKQFKQDLDALGDIKNLNIYVNSPGGDVFASQAIYSTLKRHTAYKTVYIDGLAASGASIIAMVGDKIIMPANAMMMIHNSWTYAAGNKERLREIADTMEQIDKTLVGVYSSRTGMSDEDITALLDAETWLTAEEAVTKGFADEVEKEKKVAASLMGGILMLNSLQIDLERYKNKPEIEEYTPKQPDNGDESQPAADKALQAQQIAFQHTQNKLLKIYGGNP